MGHIERLIQHYDARVSLPWERHLAGPQRVWFAVYHKGEERRLRRRLDEFEISTQRAKHGWITIDLTDNYNHTPGGENLCAGSELGINNAYFLQQ